MRQLINFYAIKETMPVARIVGQYTRGSYTDEPTSSRSHRLEVRIIQEENGNGATRVRKEILLDGVKKKMGEALGDFIAAIFLPEMLRIIERRAQRIAGDISTWRWCKHCQTTGNIKPISSSAQPAECIAESAERTQHRSRQCCHAACILG